jgi:endo-alpha-1,4-polygalactosaminidase (GH114 family)
MAVVAAVSLAVGFAGPASAVTRWLPAANPALPLHWNLGGTIDVNNAKQIGERDFNGAVLPRPAVLDIDGEQNTAATVATLHSRGQKVICYFDAGVYETYRTDASKFPKSVIGAQDDGWNGSYWLDIRQQSVLLPIMQARAQQCVDKGFDMIEPDEIDGWENDSGFPLTYNDQLSYNRAIANMAHSLGISILLKGDIIQAHDLVTSFDATLNEECYRYQECTNPYNPVTDTEVPGLQVFSAANKPVWIAEYTSTATSRMCADAPKRHWNAARYKLGLPLSGGRQPCASF